MCYFLCIADTSVLCLDVVALPCLIKSYDDMHCVLFRAEFIVHCQDVVSQYLVQLHADSSASGNIRQLIADFKDVQSRLRRSLDSQ
jgi:hypothetical protein